MKNNIAPLVRTTAFAMGVLACPTPQAFAAPPSTTTIYDFQGGTDGATPSSSLVADNAGNIYGATLTGGPADKTCSMGCGTIYQLSPPAAGQTTWTKTIIGQFAATYDGSHPNGSNPMGSLVFDKATGTIYGSTKLGGNSENCLYDACGVVFSLSPPSNGIGSWSQMAIFSFQNNAVYSVGKQPVGGVSLGTDGVLYGTTSLGGSGNDGIVFAIHPPTKDVTYWTMATYHTFSNLVTDGSIPLIGVSFYPTGNGTLYGASSTGPYDHLCGGSIFKIDLPQKFNHSGTVFTNLYQLTGDTIGCQVTGAPLLGTDGNLYSATSDAGPQKSGAVFSLAPPPAGQTAWTASLIDSLMPGNKGSHPDGGVIADSFGKLYFSTAGYATKTYPVRGAAVTELVPPAAGATLWTPKKLATFDGTNGALPMSPLVIAPNGKLYGTTTKGGAYGYGTVFEVTR